MKKLLMALMPLILCAGLVGCAGADDTAAAETSETQAVTVDHGTLSVLDVEVKQGESVDIVASFSADKYDITYSFDGESIEIADGKVKGIVENTETVVTARTEHHEASFKVKVTRNYGALTIDSIYAWTDYPAASFVPVFEKPELAETLTYTYDKTALELDTEKCTVKALKAGYYSVTASSEHYSASFGVFCEAIDRESEKFNMNDKYNALTRAQGFKTEWEESGNDGKTVLFIGDSYLDKNSFFSDFSTYYEGKDALCFGIGGSSSYHWEVLIDELLSLTDPSAIVINMGTNNVYNKADNAITCTSSLQRLFTVLHEKFPDVPIYWFDITQRTYANDASRVNMVDMINRDMRRWCSQRDWITCVEVSDSITPEMMKTDNVHVAPEHYGVFIDGLAEAGLVVPDREVSASNQ